MRVGRCACVRPALPVCAGAVPDGFVSLVLYKVYILMVMQYSRALICEL